MIGVDNHAVENQILNLLDPTFGDPLREICDQLNVSPALVLPLYIGISAAATQLNADVSFGGGILPANVSTSLLASPGQGKSSAMRMLTPSLKAFSDERVARDKSNENAHTERYSVFEALEKGLLRKLRQHADDFPKIEQIAATLKTVREQAPVPPVLHGPYIFDELSLATALDRHTGDDVCTALISEEASSLYKHLIGHGRVNQLLDGASLTTENRQAKVAINRPRLVIVSAMPTDEGLAVLNANPNIVIGGASARLLTTNPNSRTRDSVYNHAAGPEVRKYLARMNHLLSRSLSRQRDLLTLEAFALMRCDLIAKIAAQMTRPGYPLHNCMPFASRFVEHVVRLAAVIHVICYDNTVITERTIVQAYDLVRFFAREHVRIYRPEQSNDYFYAAIQDLKTYCRKRLADGIFSFPCNEILQRAPEPRTEARYQPAVMFLINNGFASTQRVQTSKKFTNFLVLNATAFDNDASSSWHDYPLMGQFVSFQYPTRYDVVNDAV